MASKLHDVGGWLLVSWDWHVGVHWPTPIPATMAFHEINVAHPFTMGPMYEPTVFFNGRNAVKDQHEPYFLWPHFPVAPDPLNMVFPLDVVFGTQQCWLPRLTVIVKDKPAAPTVFFCPLSCNNVCHTFGKIPTSLVLQTGTVETTPSLADYISGLTRMLVALAIDLVLFFLSGGYKGPSANVRVGWGNLGKNFGQFFQGRYLTTARNRIMREVVTRMTPWKWKPGSPGKFNFDAKGLFTKFGKNTVQGLAQGKSPLEAVWGGAKSWVPGLGVAEKGYKLATAP